MSRSYKKHPIVKDHTSGKWGKQQGNKAVRRDKEFSSSGKDYKKIYNSWDIHDYISYYTKEEAIKQWEAEESDGREGKYQILHDKYGTLDRWLIAWKKMMLNK